MLSLDYTMQMAASQGKAVPTLCWDYKATWTLLFPSVIPEVPTCSTVLVGQLWKYSIWEEKTRLRIVPENPLSSPNVSSSDW